MHKGATTALASQCPLELQPEITPILELTRPVTRRWLIGTYRTPGGVTQGLLTSFVWKSPIDWNAEDLRRGGCWLRSYSVWVQYRDLAQFEKGAAELQKVFAEGTADRHAGAILHSYFVGEKAPRHVIRFGVRATARYGPLLSIDRLIEPSKVVFGAPTFGHKGGFFFSMADAPLVFDALTLMTNQVRVFSNDTD